MQRPITKQELLQDFKDFLPANFPLDLIKKICDYAPTCDSCGIVLYKWDQCSRACSLCFMDVPPYCWM